MASAGLLQLVCGDVIQTPCWIVLQGEEASSSRSQGWGARSRRSRQPPQSDTPLSHVLSNLLIYPMNIFVHGTICILSQRSTTRNVVVLRCGKVDKSLSMVSL